MKKTLSAEKQDVRAYHDYEGAGVSLWWLGQAGFLIRCRDINILIDPYLSDVLAQKYKGKKFPHIRMMDTPVDMESLTDIDYCISSHAHSDHMDPGLLPLLQEISPGCRFICPDAVRATALERGVPGDRLIGLNAGNTLSLGTGMSLSAIPAAHEQIKTDEQGRHFFLGYILDLDGFEIFHPGDCLPYDGFDSWLEPHKIDLALLPVNGQKDELSEQGIAGNFNMKQACAIMRDHGIQYMIPQHFGMFDFNTVSRKHIADEAEASGLASRIFPAETGTVYRLYRD
ncbi:MAG: MBL fold metallo-hydrolase [Spirochaetales bacterium]|nr:MBL fold metallo-hydrolase [Spirochaetales bacterium]